MTQIKGAKILVVGGAGFVGSNLVHTLLDLEVGSVLVVDNLLSADRVNVPSNEPRVALIDKSINDDEVLAGLPDDLDIAFHLSTYHGNQNSIADPIADHEHNTLTSLKLFQRLSEMQGLQKVVYASAGCTVAQKTFDEAEATTEEDPVSLHLDSPYQISKIIGEFYGNYFFRRSGLPIVKARFQNVFGPREILGAGEWRGTMSTVWRNVTPTFIYKSLHGEALPVENGGIATRDFIYVQDLVDGLVACAERGVAGEVYNLASGEETSILDLAEQINKLTENPTPIDYKPARDWDRSGKRYGSVDKARREMGFEATTSLEDGLRTTVRWTRDNMADIQRCMAQHEARVQPAGVDRTTTSSVSGRNSAFWDELCGTLMAQQLGLTDDSSESLAKFDDWYLEYYPYLLQHVPLAQMAGKDVLEIGLGYGTLAARLAEVAGSYTGLDVAAGPVGMANHRVQQMGLDTAKAIQGDVLEAPFADASFDRVVSIGCLHHTGDLQAALDQVHRVLRPGGVAVLMVYSAYSYRRWLRDPADTWRYLLWDKLGLGAQPEISAAQRARYDAASDGAAAPETAFTGRHRLVEMLGKFASVSIHAENIGDELIFRRVPRPLSLRMAPSIGLDLYCTARKAS